ncbi:hypothetical protein MSAN_01471300 [Mycena sanguinolenta]|uniref:Uncharacterized protein n=1 Tax=Mycena sanguinolenta TaxID=230812 RepID=A0A8H7D133_9AGAR|nr:hypothetical protein MSAN_01471300 [Mycena sanguinolenta]
MSTLSTTNALWGQLLRKNTLAAPPTVPLPPTAPLDKTGTSMRILLHDTQANFEKFATRVDTLTSEIDEAKREIVIVKDLLQGSQESLSMDIVDLGMFQSNAVYVRDSEGGKQVNRSQTQIQKSLGDPAQAPALELFRKDVDARLDGLSKRIDDMQSFSQTQSLALQNVVQTLQSFQDQQGKILSALLPVLPLLQAVPAHIDSARSSINETILKASMETSRSHRTPPRFWPEPPQVIRKRSLPADAPSSPLLARKRPRLDDERVETLTPKFNRTSLQPNGRSSFPKRGPYFSLSSGCPPIQVPATSSLPKPPRRPLGDLPVVPQNNDSRDIRDIRSPILSNDPKDLFWPAADQTTLMPPFILRSIPQPNVNTPQTPPPSIPDAPSSPNPIPSIVDDQPTTSLSPSPETPALKVTSSVAVAPLQASTAALAKATMIRGRRSPFVSFPVSHSTMLNSWFKRDGRRFIPLDDDESDSDDDDD